MSAMIWASVRILSARDSWPPDRRGELEVGAALVHEWCRWRGVCAERWCEHGPERFSQGYDVGGAVPDLSEGSWDPRRETYGAAVARLGWRRAGGLRTIAAVGGV